MRMTYDKEVTMTSNQIAFAVHKENQRHNRFSEREGKRHNLRTERIGESNIALGYSNLNEMFRHNYATEGINQQLADIKGKEAETHVQETEIKRYEAKTKRRAQYFDAISGISKWAKPVLAAGYAVADLIGAADISSDDLQPDAERVEQRKKRRR